MKAPCELVSNVVLPSIRAWIVRESVKKGIKQKDVAKTLGLTDAAVSQYLKKKRADIGVSEKELKQIKPLIDDITKRIVAGKLTDFDLMKLICKACISLRASLVLCKLHMIAEPKLKKIDCTFCEELLRSYRKLDLK